MRALLIADGIVGGPETRAQFAGRADDAFIDPDAIASTALHPNPSRPFGLEF